MKKIHLPSNQSTHEIIVFDIKVSPLFKADQFTGAKKKVKMISRKLFYDLLFLYSDAMRDSSTYLGDNDRT